MGNLPDITKLLIEHGANVNAQNNYGKIPLHNALNNGSYFNFK